MSSRRPIIRKVSGPPEPPSRRSENDPEDSTAGFVDLPLDHSEPPPELGFSRPDAPPAGIPASTAYAGRTAGRRQHRPWLWGLLFMAAVPLGLFVGYSLQPLPGAPVLSSDLVAFGEVAVGRSSERAVRLSNAGEGPLDVQRWSVVDDPSHSFELESAPDCLGRSLPAGATCEARLRFTPQQDGALQARLKLITGKPSQLEVQSLPLLGRGAVPKLELRPSLLDFPATTVGYRSAPLSLMLHNPGDAPLSIDAVELRGLAAADFVQADPSCAGSRLAPDAECRLSFHFVPTRAGERRADLSLRTTPSLPISTVVLRGLGEAQQPRLAVSAHELDFGDIRLGDRSQPWPVTLTNEGDGPLVLQGLALRDPVDGSFTGSVARSPDRFFRLSTSDCLDQALEPGASCTLSVGFEPNGELGELPALDFGAVLRVDHNAAAAAYRLPMVGRGTAPRLRMDRERMTFGTRAVGSPSPWTELRLSNTGSAELDISRVSLRGADAERFDVSAEGCTGAYVPPGRSCSVQVRFTAKRPGPHRAELHVRHDGVDGPKRIPVNGLGSR